MSFQKNIFSQYSAQLINVACTFLCSIIVAKTLGSSGKGSLDLYATMYSFGVILFGVGLPQAITNFIASRSISKKKVLSSTLLFSVFGALLFFLFVLIIHRSGLAQSFFSNEMKGITWKIILSVHVFYLIINATFSAILFGEQQFSKAAFITALGALVLLCLYSITYFYCTDSHALYYFALAAVVVLLIQCIFYLKAIFSLKSGYHFSTIFSVQELKPIFAFSFLVFVTNVFQFFNYKMDVWFLQHYHHNTSMIGIYTLAVSLAQMVWILPKVYHDVLATETAADNTIIDKIKKSSSNMIYYSMLAGGVGFGLSIFLVPLLFGLDFTFTYTYIGILLLGIIPMSGAMCMSAYFSGIKRIDINLQGTILGFATCLILDIILIPKYNSIGACWATVASYVVTSFYYYYRFYTLHTK